jgi:hypothetical protein
MKGLHEESTVSSGISDQRLMQSISTFDVKVRALTGD